MQLVGAWANADAFPGVDQCQVFKGGVVSTFLDQAPGVGIWVLIVLHGIPDIQVFDARWDPFSIKMFQFGPWLNLLIHEGYTTTKEISFLLHENELLVPNASEIIEDILRAHDENTV